MKTTKIAQLLIALCLLINCTLSDAQNAANPKIAVIDIDFKDAGPSPSLLGNYLRTELARIQRYEVTDRYDQDYLFKKEGFKTEGCYGKICLVEAGTLLGVDKMMTGIVDNYGETMLITLNLIDVKSKSIEKSFVKEYLNLPKEFPVILALAVNEMHGLPNSEVEMKKYTKKFNIENEVNNAGKKSLNLEGPRFGAVLLSGQDAEVVKNSRNKGGYEGYPIFFQFGYQFESQYLTQGKLQALFEFLPMISGIEQGMFIPSMTILHGLRNSHNGFEFAFGPTIRMTKLAKGYYDEGGEWRLQKEWTGSSQLVSTQLRTRPDSRGYLTVEGGFVFAVGFTIKSGTLNIPVNTYIVPSNKSLRVGASFGFNTKRN